MFKTIGKLRYSPKTLGDQNSPNWWLILDTDQEIGKYYRQLYHLATFRCSKLEKPAWADHVTVIRNEEPPNKLFWEKYEGLDVEIEVESIPQTNGHYTWLGVKCELLLQLREELGLTREPKIPLHLSFGHSGNRQATDGA